MFDWIAELVTDGGYFGVAVLMFAENLFPPIPSELIMPLAGFVAAGGEMNLTLAILSGSAGSLGGAFFWYGIGLWVGGDRLKQWAGRHGRWLTLAPDDVDRACRWFNRHCAMAVFIGRLVPGVRTLISVPAGIAGVPLRWFLLYSALGTVTWTALLAGAGYLLESKYRDVAGWINPVANGVIAILVLCYLYRLVTFRHQTPKP